MRLADGLGVKPVRIAGPPRVPSVTRRLGPRFSGAADGCCAKDDETHANGSPSVAAAARPLPVLRNRLRVNIPVSSFARPAPTLLAYADEQKGSAPTRPRSGEAG